MLSPLPVGSLLCPSPEPYPNEQTGANSRLSPEQAGDPASVFRDQPCGDRGEKHQRTEDRIKDKAGHSPMRKAPAEVLTELPGQKQFVEFVVRTWHQ